MAEGELVERTESGVSPDEAEPLVEEPSIEASGQESRPKAYKVIHPVKPRRKRPAGTREEFPLSYLAGILGLLSLAFVWNYEPSANRGYEVFTALRYLTDMGEYHSVYSAIVFLMLVGSVLCFVTSFGSLFQLGGVVLYGFELAGDSLISGPGPFVAVAATLIGVAAILMSAYVRVPPRLVSFVRDERGTSSVNALAISAFALGVLSVLLIWVVRQYSFDPSYLWPISYVPDPEYYSLLSFLSDTRVSDLSLMIVGASLLVMGSVMCLLTPLGSFAQMVGTVLCFLEIRSSFGDVRHYSFWTIEVDIGAGFYVAIAATAAGLLSMVFVWRLRIPGRFASGAPAQLGSRPDTNPEPLPLRGAAHSRYQAAARLQDRMPRIVRVLLVVAVALALAISTLAVPGILPLSVIKVHIGNASPLYDLDLGIYVDGEAVAFGMVTPFNEYVVEHRTSSGIHTLSLDYAFSGDEDPSLDGSIDWASSVDVDPYSTSTVRLDLMGDIDVRSPQVNLSAAPSSNGYTVTFESVVDYGPYTATYYTHVDWSSISLVVVEAYVSGVVWSFHGYELDEAPYDMEYCGVEFLGSLGLNCTAYDVSGDGEAGQGDFITLSVYEGDFSSSSEYVAYLIYEPHDSVIGQVTLSG